LRIESPRNTERIGSVAINDVQKVLELDSGRAKELPLEEKIAVQKVEEDTIKSFERKMAIVIPTKDEKIKLFEGVISGVPHECLIIVISNSKKRRVDHFKMERDTLNQFCRFTRRRAFIIHQKDPVLAQALVGAGYPDLLGGNGRVRDGKAEGMLAAMLIAMMMKKQYVGFIDADNYFPGAVWEYARCYASGFAMSKSPYTMVRILWHYKPKMSRGMYFKKWGRVSQVTNKCLNSLISAKTGFESEVIKTGNAGEHAMTLRLARMLPYASGYAVEPQELISILEMFGGMLPTARSKALKHGVEIFQIETANPHIHEEKGKQHLKGMLSSGLGSLYYSRLCGGETKEVILGELRQQEAIGENEEPPVPRLYPPLNKVDIEKFAEILEENMSQYALPEKKQ